MRGPGCLEGRHRRWGIARRLRPPSTLRAGTVLAAGALAAVVATSSASCHATNAANSTTVAAAASLRGVMPLLADAYARASPEAPPLAFTFGASGTLRQQVEGGAPIDAVVLASAAPVDALIAAGRCAPDSRRTLATNRLVLIGPSGTRPHTFATLAALGPDERLAIGDPASVPAGRYAKDALERLGVWPAVQDHLLLGLDVSFVLAYARRGEVAAAIVYATEVQGIDGVEIHERAEGPWAPTPEVVGATVADGPGATAAAAFLAFAAGPDGQRILKGAGFGPPP